MMIGLEYRLDELHDEAQRRALIDDILAHYADDYGLGAFLRAVETAIGEASDTARAYIKELEDKVADLEDEVSGLCDSVAELRSDADYWRERAGE